MYEHDVFLTLINQYRLFDFIIEAAQCGKKMMIRNGINFRQFRIKHEE